MNRRDILKTALILPLVPYISTKYKTPSGFEPFERLTNEKWIELPFEEIQRGDIIRRQYIPKIHYNVEKVYPYRGMYNPETLQVKQIV